MGLTEKITFLIPLFILVAVALTVLGITLLTLRENTIHKEFSFDYTNCNNSANSRTCYQDLVDGTNEGINCVCYMGISLSGDLEGDIVIYYELNSFDQRLSSYVNSRDDDQLNGVLNAVPSINCEPFRYTEDNKPIAPCGEIADTMFTDTFNIIKKDFVAYNLTSGAIAEADKVGFRNPENWRQASQNFSKPKSWGSNFDIFYTESNETENIAFENEIFIGWMKTEWKRKPYKKIDTRILTRGDYIFRIQYNNHVSLKTAKRSIILASTNVVINQTMVSSGVITLLIGVVVFFLILAVCIKIRQSKERNEITEVHPALFQPINLKEDDNLN